MRESFKRETYNDDMSIESFAISARHFDGEQRRGVTEAHLGCLNLQERTEKALRGPFPLSPRTPIPDRILDASLFVDNSHPNAVLSFWNDHLSEPQFAVGDSASLHDQRNTLIPLKTYPSAGKIQLPALTHLAQLCNAGGSEWMQQFLYGFPLIGRLSQKHCVPVKPKEAQKLQRCCPKS